MKLLVTYYRNYFVLLPKSPGFKVQQVATKRGNDGASVKAKDVNSVSKYLLVGL
jgi:hypothetical protein